MPQDRANIGQNQFGENWRMAFEEPGESGVGVLIENMHEEDRAT